MKRPYAFILGVLLLLVLSATNAKAQIAEAADATDADPCADAVILKKATDALRTPRDSFFPSPQGIKKLLDECPDSALAPLLRPILEGLREKAATHELNVAMFYRNVRFSSEAAEMRLQEIIEKYPDYSRMGEALYQLSLVYFESGRRDEAKERVVELLTRFPNSTRAADARTLLDTLLQNR